MRQKAKNLITVAAVAEPLSVAVKSQTIYGTDLQIYVHGSRNDNRSGIGKVPEIG